jgi:RNA-binding protein PNO1
MATELTPAAFSAATESHQRLSGPVTASGSVELRRVAVPAHRYAPLKSHWMALYEPLTKELGLQVRMNLKQRAVELRTSDRTRDRTALQRGYEFVEAFLLGFAVEDAVALLRFDDLRIDSFEVQDVRRLQGDHLARAIGRVAGTGGRTKFAIENACRVRIVLAGPKIHILGGHMQVRLARDAICSLILGAPPGKTYEKLRRVSARLKEHF